MNLCIYSLSQWLFTSLTYVIIEAVGILRKSDSWASQFTCGEASPSCQIFFGTDEQSNRGEMLCRRSQARYMPLGPGICFLALHLLCPVGGMGRAPLWHDLVPATALCCNSKGPTRHTSSSWSEVGSLHQHSCCTRANVARLPVELVLGRGPLPSAPAGGTSDICYCWYQPWLYHKKSSRPRGRAKLHGVEPETLSLDSNAPHCWAAVGGGVGPCGSFVVLSGLREKLLLLRVEFEPTQEDPIWFLVKRLNHSPSQHFHGGTAEWSVCMSSTGAFWRQSAASQRCIWC